MACVAVMMPLYTGCVNPSSRRQCTRQLRPIISLVAALVLQYWQVDTRAHRNPRGARQCGALDGRGYPSTNPPCGLPCGSQPLTQITYEYCPTPTTHMQRWHWRPDLPMAWLSESVQVPQPSLWPGLAQTGRRERRPGQQQRNTLGSYTSALRLACKRSK